jgi:hypothetical protein
MSLQQRCILDSHIFLRSIVMRSSGKERLRETGREDSRRETLEDAQVPDEPSRNSDPPTPILQSDDGKLIDEDAPD